MKISFSVPSPAQAHVSSRLMALRPLAYSRMYSAIPSVCLNFVRGSERTLAITFSGSTKRKRKMSM